MIAPAAEGNVFNVIARLEDVPLPQLLVPFTVILPDIALAPKFTLIVFVVLVPVAPVGKVQMYEVALAIVGIV